jgi:outer membrane protein assembly factor BamC
VENDMRHLALAGALVSVVAGALTGCGVLGGSDEVIRDRSVEYKSSSSLPPLEVPPDLSRSNVEERLVVPDAAPPGGTATYSSYAQERTGAARVTRSGVLPSIDGLRVLRDGDPRWLVADGEPSAYWERVRAFWLENGFVLRVDSPASGILETDWAENRADVPHSVIRSLLGKVGDFVYSTATRDKFRTRLERASQGRATEIFLSHRGVEEVAQGDTTVWQPRAADPELEAEMLTRLMMFLGVKEDRARQMVAERTDRPPRARLERDASGGSLLVLDGDLPQSWRRTGLALDRVGFTVEERDRNRGVYVVRYVDPLAGGKKDEGMLSKLKFWGDSEPARNVDYLIGLQGQGAATRVVVLTREGVRDTSDTASRILALLHNELK